MTEKIKDNKRKITNYNKGEISFGLEIIIFVILIFIIWILAGGPKEEKPSGGLLLDPSSVDPSSVLPKE